MSTKRSVGKAVLAPLVAAGTSVAASYVVKKGPRFAEETLLPWLRDVVQRAGGAAEKLPDRARSAAGSGGDLAEQLTDRARGATGDGDTSASGGRMSRNELSERSEERARRRAQRRRKATTKRK